MMAVVVAIALEVVNVEIYVSICCAYTVCDDDDDDADDDDDDDDDDADGITSGNYRKQNRFKLMQA